MKDIDFDELDRAVNTLMSDKTAAAAPPTTLPNGEPSVATAGQEQPTISSVPTTDQQPGERSDNLIIKPRSGRFMDVVHPSSDMKTTVMTPDPGASNPPTVPAMDQTSAAAAPPASSPTNTLGAKAPRTIEWPDPIDAHEAAQSEEVPQTPAETTSPAAPPQTSPFLPDTKVEKRPLGGPATEAALSDELAKITPQGSEASKNSDVLKPKTEEEAETDQSSSDAPEEPQANHQLPENLDDAKPPLPPELDSDLVAIESGESTTQESDETADNNQTLVASEPQTAQPATAEAPTSGVSTPPAAALMNGSIPQQYTESPSSGDVSHAPIYGAEEAPQALSHPAKKKSGWLWVLWILLILIVAMGLGAAAYFMNLF